jgi:hypothetical protein
VSRRESRSRSRWFETNAGYLRSTGFVTELIEIKLGAVVCGEASGKTRGAALSAFRRNS